MAARICTLNEGTLQELFNFISESVSLPPGWTLGRVISTLSRAQAEVTENRTIDPMPTDGNQHNE